MQLALPQLSVLDEPTRERVSGHALTILRDAGFRVHSSAMRQKLKAVGANVDDAREVVCLPPKLVAEAEAATPGAFDLYNLDGHARRVSPGTIADHVGSYIEALRWLAHGAPQLRPSTLGDLRRGLQVAETLDLVSVTGPTVWPLDVPTERQLPETLLAILRSTRKSLNFGFQNREHGELILEAGNDGPEQRRQRKVVTAGLPGRFTVWRVAAPGDHLRQLADQSAGLRPRLRRGAAPGAGGGPGAHSGALSHGGRHLAVLDYRHSPAADR